MQSPRGDIALVLWQNSGVTDNWVCGDGSKVVNVPSEMPITTPSCSSPTWPWKVLEYRGWGRLAEDMDFPGVELL